MKKSVKWIAMLLVVGLLATSLVGCFGSFNLTRKLYTWNSKVGDKWINTVVFWVLNFIPVYGVCGAADFYILNTIEFWTGSNPVTLDGQSQSKTLCYEGVEYQVTATENRIDVVRVDNGQTASLVFDPATSNWTLAAQDVNFTVAHVGENDLTLFAPDGQSVVVNR